MMVIQDYSMDEWYMDGYFVPLSEDKNVLGLFVSYYGEESMASNYVSEEEYAKIVQEVEKAFSSMENNEIKR